MSAQQPQQQYSTQPAQSGQPGQQPTYNQQAYGPPKNVSNDDLIMYLVCFFCPPLAVFWLKGGCEQEVIIDVILWCLFWFPGFIYALYLILQSHSVRDQERAAQGAV